MLDSKSNIFKATLKFVLPQKEAVRYLFHVPPKESLLEKLISPPPISTTAKNWHSIHLSNEQYGLADFQMVYWR